MPLALFDNFIQISDRSYVALGTPTLREKYVW